MGTERIEISVSYSVGSSGFSSWKTESEPHLPEDYLCAFSVGADKVIVDGVQYRKVEDVATNSRPCYAYRKLVYERA